MYFLSIYISTYVLKNDFQIIHKKFLIYIKLAYLYTNHILLNLFINVLI